MSAPQYHPLPGVCRGICSPGAGLGVLGALGFPPHVRFWGAQEYFGVGVPGGFGGPRGRFGGPRGRLGGPLGEVGVSQTVPVVADGDPLAQGGVAEPVEVGLHVPGEEPLQVVSVCTPTARNTPKPVRDLPDTPQTHPGAAPKHSGTPPNTPNPPPDTPKPFKDTLTPPNLPRDSPKPPHNPPRDPPKPPQAPQPPPGTLQSSPNVPITQSGTPKPTLDPQNLSNSPKTTVKATPPPQPGDN